MAQKTLSLNVPLRPAPPPPSSGSSRSSNISHVLNGSSEPSRTPLSDSRKKKSAPPPRPPPPKPSAQLRAVQNAVFFTEAIQPKRPPPPPQSTLLLMSSQTTPDLLINWDSPPASPTPGRSSSDGLSLKSFGSDSSGTATSSGMGGGFGHRSESGFESETDAWTIGESSSGIPRPSSQPSFLAESVKPFSMPTIIRPNRSAGSKGIPPPPPSSGSSTHLKALEKVNAIRPASPSGYYDFSGGVANNVGSSSHLADLLDLDCNEEWTNEDQNHSPPEPSIPPPPPPAAAAPPSILLTESSPPPVAASCPSALALYDYDSPHSGDLNFKEGDRILLKARVNEEWFQGSLNSLEGMFPVSFVRILVPLSSESDQSSSVDNEPSSSSHIPVIGSSYCAVVIYNFTAETGQDLTLHEGDQVEVTESLGNGWLYGIHSQSGQSGQFPESFVQRLT